MLVFLVWLVDFIVRVVTIVVIVQALLSYFMSPYHPLRATIDRLLAPLLNPIRRLIPSTGMLDFSPLVLIILVQIVGYLLKVILLSI
jgi:YggT family protein